MFGERECNYLRVESGETGGSENITRLDGWSTMRR